MDEKFGMTFEDVDYCLRAWKAGYRSLYFPSATIVHHESLSRGKVQGKRELESKDYFWRKWGEFFDNRNVISKNGKPRIIYVLKTTGVSGGIKMVYKHLNNLAERGYEVELYSLDKDPDWLKLNVKHTSFKNFDQLIDELSKQEAIKVATWWETSLPVWLSSVVSGIPVFYVQDIETSYYLNDKRMQNTVLSNYKFEFEYLTISQWDVDELKKLHMKATNIGCGIDLDLFFPLKGTKREENTMVALGRGEPLKNFALTLNGWKKISGDKPKLWLFGVEPDLVKPNRDITYFFKPTDEKINELYNKATIFTQTSLHEGFCLTALEAMAAGATVITTDSDGNRDYCVDNKNCLMIEQNNPIDMKEKIEKALSDKKLRDRLRKEGYVTAKKYGWPKITDKLEKFYNEVAKQK
jgi:glycosyltransferase involved in cell wall biosynthesis